MAKRMSLYLQERVENRQHLDNTAEAMGDCVFQRFHCLLQDLWDGFCWSLENFPNRFVDLGDNFVGIDMGIVIMVLNNP